jgi:hypothetical protein
MLVSQKFVVPTNDIIWPEETWGTKLGSVVSGIRCKNNYVTKRADLKSIGFEFNFYKQSNEYELVRVALVKYKELKGDMLVLRKFIVPTNDITWPEETWGMKLGNVVHNIRRGNSHVDKRTDLESTGFNYHPQSLSHGYKIVKVALQTYKDLNGDMMVPATFIVLVNDINWHIETWGLELGSVVLVIRRGKSYANKRVDLESFGFNYDSKNKNRYCGFELIKAALQTYEDLHGDMIVPATFVVPTNDTTWPEESWGLNLGNVVSNIRLEESYVKNRADLESIGFDSILNKKDIVISQFK